MTSTAILTRETCDRCPAVAQFRTFLTSGELFFCAHHYAENEQALTEAGALALPLNEN